METIKPLLMERDEISLPGIKTRAKGKSRIKNLAVLGWPLFHPIRMGTTSSLGRILEDAGGIRIALYADATPTAFRLLSEFGCDAAIVRVTSEAIRREAMKVKLPLVNASSWLEHPGVPTVRHDYLQVGRQAAEYLLAKGVRQFGCVMFPGGWYIQRRHQAFVEVLQQHGITPQTIHLKSHYPQKFVPLSLSERRRFRDWLNHLTLPATLVLTEDYDAGVLMQVCREAGLEIPRDLSLLSLGTHGNEAPPWPLPLTAVQEDNESQMQQMIALLRRQVRGLPLAQTVVEIPPLGVIERESTRDGHITDHAIRRSLHLICAKGDHPLTVGELVRVAQLTRITFERRFKKATGRSPGDYLIARRLENAQARLRLNPAADLQATAKASGFRNYDQMQVTFKRKLGLAPKIWLQKQRSTQLDSSCQPFPTGAGDTSNFAG